MTCFTSLPDARAGFRMHVSRLQATVISNMFTCFKFIMSCHKCQNKVPLIDCSVIRIIVEINMASWAGTVGLIC